MATQTLVTKRGFILYDDALASHASEAWFSPQHWQRHGGLRGTAGGRGAGWIVAGEDGEWVLRHYRRGGLAARLNTDAYLWTGLERSRPWREWRLLAELYKEGLPVPQPVAANIQRSGLICRGDLITRLIPDARSLASRLKDAHSEALPWPAIGACIRRFHEAGVYHADLNVHNVLIDSRDEVYLIDFDRGARRAPGRRWQQGNLERLSRSLRKSAVPAAAERAAWSGLLDGYDRRPA
ncbi:MAG: 3-deoxy-D-manno-octulosonic acid kinase [Gammaproteobacteria bacterium]|nr:3-deoxy-D-manno-octulosonic acid kinase [Gammaproteobacteria bacterium]